MLLGLENQTETVERKREKEREPPSVSRVLVCPVSTRVTTCSRLALYPR